MGPLRGMRDWALNMLAKSHSWIHIVNSHGWRKLDHLKGKRRSLILSFSKRKNSLLWEYVITSSVSWGSVFNCKLPDAQRTPRLRHHMKIFQAGGMQYILTQIPSGENYPQFWSLGISTYYIWPDISSQ